MKLTNIRQWTGGELQGQDVAFQGVSIDTRTIKANELFIALKGPNFDGHQFIENAIQQGAAAALVMQPIPVNFPYLLVENTHTALGQLAAGYRKSFTLPLIAVTGSCGKTTTKTLIASILQQQGSTLATEGTLNNDIGVPLTLLRLNSQHQYAVIEMGANHHGEINYVTQLAQPTVALITNAAPVHLAGFGDVAGVAKAKGEIFNGLALDGTAVINADDIYADYWRNKVSSKKILQFGIEKSADISASNIQLDEEGRVSFSLHTPKGNTAIQLQLFGKHQVMNALAAAAAAYAVGAGLIAIKQGLEEASPVAKRLVLYPGRGQTTVMDDSYNANPTATRAALSLLAERQGEKIFVLGDMLELGTGAEDFHSEIGEIARHLGVKALYAYGHFAKFAAKTFGQQGYYFNDQQQLITALQQAVRPGTTILVKGSKAMTMWRVVEALKEQSC